MGDDRTHAWMDALEERSNLTRSQFLIWTGQQVDPLVPLYNIIHATHLRGPLSRARFEQAFEALVGETDVLRTVILIEAGAPRQTVLAEMGLRLEWVDLSGETDPVAAYRQWQSRRIRRPLDLSERLFDTALVALGPEHHVWYLNQHHVITDAWSFQLLTRRLAELYAEENIGDPLPPFMDYVARERALRGDPSLDRAREYWATRLSEPARRIDFYGAGTQTPGPRTHRVRQALGRARSKALLALARREDLRMLGDELSQFRLLTAVTAAFLSRVSGHGPLAIGSPVHNRPGPVDKATPGLFIEMFPLFTRTVPGERFIDLIQRLGPDLMDWLSHARPGLSSMQSNTAYDVVLNFLGARMPAFPGLVSETDWVHSDFGDRAHKLRIQVHDLDGRGALCVDFDFNRSVFDVEREHLAVRHFMTLLDALLDDEGQVIDAVDLADPVEREHQLVAFNRTAADFPAGATLPGLLAKAWAEHPDRPAVTCGERTLSCAELALRVDAEAARLSAMGAAAGRIVALAMPRDIDAVVMVLAILRTGAAYLPLDAAHPEARLRGILEEVAESGLAALVLPAGQSPPAGLDVRVVHPGEVTDTAPAPPSTWPDPDDIAYLVYTSGSSGRPKGVRIHHRSLLNYVSWARGQYCPDAPPRVALHTSLGVDLTVTSLFLPLLAGGEVVIYPDTGAADLPVLRVFREDAVDIVKLTPAHLELVREQGLETRHIHTLILGGETLRTDLAGAALEQLASVSRLFNEYGPTEATVGCMIHAFDPARDTRATVPIGKPIANTRIYCLDAEGRPSPTGVVGELCIAGAGVAGGYLRADAAEDACFQPDPFHPGERMYRSGDAARWLPSGELAFLGRLDRQVKLRGTRIEPGEIEAALTALEGVEQAVVGVLEPSGEADRRACARCGIPSNYPGLALDEAEVCSICRAFERFAEQASGYFGTVEQLRDIAAEVRAAATGEHDAIVLLSGGKDSTYMLHQLAGMNLRLLAVTLDNGFISGQAMDNARRSAAELGVEHLVVGTPHMNAIFADSLARHSNVCHGCFKTIYTLAMKEARERGIGTIFTGLSRGQIFETRLDDMFRQRRFDVAEIEQAILDARRAYHRIDDAVARLLDTGLFRDDRVFDEIRFVDFYRYVDVPLEEVYRFLDERAPWVRPADTGRSTNCLINDAGIYVHRRERGYHNYALPYSWDVRLGHKTRDAAMQELDDRIDTPGVRAILREIGYVEKPARHERRLVAWYSGDPGLAATGLRTALAATLPAEMIPWHLVHVSEWPLNATGKVDLEALPQLSDTHEVATEFIAPASDIEHRVAAIWSDILQAARIGVHDDFFELGGRSLNAVQVMARVREAFQVELPMRRFFDEPTVAGLANAVEAELIAEINSLSDEEVLRLLDNGAP